MGATPAPPRVGSRSPDPEPPVREIPADLLTVAEASGYRRTSYHREVLEFLARV